LRDGLLNCSVGHGQHPAANLVQWQGSEGMVLRGLAPGRSSLFVAIRERPCCDQYIVEATADDGWAGRPVPRPCVAAELGDPTDGSGESQACEVVLALCLS